MCGSSPTCHSSFLLFFVCAHPHSWNVTTVCICPRSPNLCCVLKPSQTAQSESALCAYVRDEQQGPRPAHICSNLPLSTLLSPLWATTLEGQGTKWKNNKLQSVKFYTDPPFKICLFSSYFLWTNLKNKQDEWFFMMLDHSLWIIVTRRIGQAFFVEFKHPPLGQDILAFKHSEHSVFLFYTVIQRDCNL